LLQGILSELLGHHGVVVFFYRKAPWPADFSLREKLQQLWNASSNHDDDAKVPSARREGHHEAGEQAKTERSDIKMSRRPEIMEQPISVSFRETPDETHA
jgi:hypothetical protein